MRGTDVTLTDRDGNPPNITDAEKKKKLGNVILWDGITEDYGYSIFETPEWPKPAKCRNVWGPTNRRYAARNNNSFSGGRNTIPATFIRPGDPLDAPESTDGGVRPRKSSVAVLMGYKQGMQFLNTAWEECGVSQKSASFSNVMWKVPDEDDIHVIGLARDPMSKAVSAYKEIVFRLQYFKFKRDSGASLPHQPWWHKDETSVYPGIGEASTCLDWSYVGVPTVLDDLKKTPDWTPEEERLHEDKEIERFLGYLEALHCGCRCVVSSSLRLIENLIQKRRGFKQVSHPFSLIDDRKT